MPLFDPLDDPVPFAFPVRNEDGLETDAVSYRFSRPSLRLMVDEVENSGLFGHIVLKKEPEAEEGKKKDVWIEED